MFDMISRIYKNHFDKTKLKFLENIAMEKKKQGQARIKKTAIWFFVALICLACFNLQAAECKRYIVSPNTSSTNWQAAEWTNYPSTPSCIPVTPQTAFDKAVAGDTVYFRGGTYNYEGETDDKNSRFYPANNGTNGNYIEFRNYPDELPIFNDTNKIDCNSGMMGVGGDGDGVPKHSRSYIILNGFKFTKEGEGSPRMGIIQSDHIIVKNIEIVGKYMAEFPYGNYDLIRIEDSSYITIQNCLLYGNHDGNKGHGSAVKDYSSHHVTIEKCTFYDCDVAFERKGSNEYAIFRYNYGYNIGLVSPNKQFITLVQGSGANEGDHFMEIYQNVYYADHADATSFFKMDNEASINTNNIKIYNNTIHSTEWGYVNAQKSDGMMLWNNIVVGVDSSRRIIETQDNVTYDYIDYNLYNPFTKMDVGATTYSTWAGWTSSGGLSGNSNPDIHSIHGQNPLFVSPGAGGPENYKLATGSPAIKAGIDLQDYDNDGNTGESINMGAYITGNEQIGCNLTIDESTSYSLEPPKDLNIRMN
jgi:hypothetical protein